MRFVETPVFTRSVCELLDDEQYRRLQLALVLRPEQGSIIKGGGGLRKIRWGGKGSGKRGGLRVIYYWDRPSTVIYMLLVYSKHDQEDLTSSQLRHLGRLVREEFK
jgi:mRNA-degrading endonuclease RelE of RelBE toxin-antitoxin system